MFFQYTDAIDTVPTRKRIARSSGRKMDNFFLCIYQGTGRLKSYRSSG